MYTFVSIFKTSVSSDQEKIHILDQLYRLDTATHCHIDLDDEDRILRICSTDICTDQIQELMATHAIECELLDVFERGGLVHANGDPMTKVV